MKRTLIAVMLVGATAVPVIAQDNPQQTPDNAALFLNKLAAAGQMSLRIESPSWSGGGWNTNNDRVNGRDIHQEWSPYRTTGYTVDRKCRGRIHYVAGSPRFANGMEQKAPSTVVSENVGDKTGWPVDWTKVPAVASEGATITIPSEVDDRIQLVFPTNDLATRAAFAMEVIRQSCDPTSGTGF